ncbi:MAG: (2Fe-2S)-binding protein [Oligoflexia bacterium]|nr:(2Fe-2S)-binding protein [Oligoflexia bacterium]
MDIENSKSSEHDIKKDFSIVCRCKAVNHKTIRKAIESGADNIEKIRAKTKANTGCGKSCTEKILEMIASYSR